MLFSITSQLPVHRLPRSGKRTPAEERILPRSACTKIGSSLIGRAGRQQLFQ